jgi:hypothetical protein
VDPENHSLVRLSESALSHLSDNVVLLKYVQDDHSIQRAVSVIKSRASYHHPDTRPFLIGRDGIVLTEVCARGTVVSPWETAAGPWCRRLAGLI